MVALLKAFKGTGTFKWNFVVALLKAFSGTYKWNFANLKKCQNPEDLRILTLFSDFQNSTFMCLYRPCKLFRLFIFFPSVAVQYLCGHLGRKSVGTLHRL